MGTVRETVEAQGQRSIGRPGLKVRERDAVDSDGSLMHGRRVVSPPIGLQGARLTEATPAAGPEALLVRRRGVVRCE